MTIYRRLDANKIVATARLLQSRIAERFPLSGLSRLGDEVSTVAEETLGRLAWIQKPHIGLRLGVFMLVVVILFVLGLLFATLRVSDTRDLATFIQMLGAGFSCIFFIGTSVIFLLTWESRIKRNRALASIHELRAMAHIVDMHQLTKDPGAGGRSWAQTASSPRRSLTPFELGRYLDYCSEMLSIIGKIAALYSQSVEDPVVLDAVDDVEDLTTELSQKIWQKIALLDKNGIV